MYYREMYKFSLDICILHNTTHKRRQSHTADNTFNMQAFNVHLNKSSSSVSILFQINTNLVRVLSVEQRICFKNISSLSMVRMHVLLLFTEVKHFANDNVLLQLC